MGSSIFPRISGTGSLDRDHDRAATVAIEVFTTIYQLPADFDMDIEAH